jgi:hypothetical protein
VTAVADLAMIPARVLAALGLGTQGLTPERVRERLAVLAVLDPELARSLADELAVCALRLVASGHPRGAELARDTLVVLDALAGVR